MLNLYTVLWVVSRLLIYPFVHHLQLGQIVNLFWLLFNCSAKRTFILTIAGVYLFVSPLGHF